MALRAFKILEILFMRCFSHRETALVLLLFTRLAAAGRGKKVYILFTLVYTSIHLFTYEVTQV